MMIAAAAAHELTGAEQVNARDFQFGRGQRVA
jgi:hypothetical protein